MERKKIIKFINETISNPRYDFLGINSMNEEEDNYHILNSYEFQQKFLYDLLFNKSKVKINTSEAKIKKESEGDLRKGKIDIEYSADVIYEYNENEFEFNIEFEGDNILYKITSSEYDGRKTIVIDWESINYDVYSNLGDLIDFEIFNKIKDKRIERNFIKEFIGIFIEKEILD